MQIKFSYLVSEFNEEPNRQPMYQSPLLSEMIINSDKETSTDANSILSKSAKFKDKFHFEILRTSNAVNTPEHESTFKK